MSRVTIDKLTIRVRGASIADVRRLAANLGPSVQRALAKGDAPIASQRQVDVRVKRGAGGLADRIATPLASALRGKR